MRRQQNTSRQQPWQSMSSTNTAISQKLLSGKQIVIFGGALFLGGLLLILLRGPAEMTEGIHTLVVKVVDRIGAAVDSKDAPDLAVLALVPLFRTGLQGLLAAIALIRVVLLLAQRSSEILPLIGDKGNHICMIAPTAVKPIGQPFGALHTRRQALYSTFALLLLLGRTGCG